MELAALLADDLHGAFPAFVAELGGQVYSLALRLGGRRDAAEDIAQDTFLKAYTALRGYDASRVRALCLRPWVMTIALNVARNRLRSSARHPEAPLDAEPHTTTTCTTAYTTAVESDRADLRATLAAALLHLPLAARQAVVLRHVVGCTTAEVASILGRPEGTVKAQVARGLAKLRATLSEQEERQ